MFGILLYFILFLLYLVFKYFHWKILIKTKYKNNNIFDENFSVFIIIFLSWFLWFWTLFNEVEIRENGIYSQPYFCSILVIILIIILYIFKIIILRKKNVSNKIKVFFLVLSNMIEIILFLLVGADLLN